MPEGGRGGRAAGRTARTKPHKAAQRSGDGEEGRKCSAGVFVRQRAQRRAWRHDAGKGKARADKGAALAAGTASASQSDCKRVPETACPLVRRMEYYEKKENSRDLTCRSREFLVQ